MTMTCPGLPDFLSHLPVVTAPLPSRMEGAACSGVLWQAAPGRFMLRIPHVANYLVEGGERVTIDPSPEAGNNDVDRCLRSTPLSALLFQRGVLAFHAAALVSDHGAVLIAGDSGAGKSALLTALLARGWRFLADDLSAVDADDDGMPMVFPISPEVALWPDTMERRGMESKGEGRQVLSMEERFVPSAQPLVAVYRLSVHTDDEAVLSRVEGTKLFKVLALLSYNSRIAHALFDRGAHMRQTGAVARTVPVYSLERSRGRWSDDRLADLVEANHGAGAMVHG